VGQRLAGKRREQDRVRQVLAEQRHSGVPRSHVAEQARQNLRRIESRPIGAQCGLETAAARDVGLMCRQQEARRERLVVARAQDVRRNPRQGRVGRGGRGR
jgi:hypothetical protein